jgi:hypothetical protein
LGDVSEHDADVLWPVEGGVEIDILEVHGGKLSVTLGAVLIKIEKKSSKLKFEVRKL